MKQKSIVITILLFSMFVFAIQARQDEQNAIGASSPDLRPPVLKAEVFPLTEFILDFNENITDFRHNLTILNHGTPIITDDRKEIYSPGVVTLQNIDGRWIKPVFASFSGKFVDVNPTLSADGKRLYFFRSFEGIGSGEDGIYFVEKQGKSWTESKKIDPIIFSFCDGYQITESLDRTIYFGSSKGNDNRGWSDLYKSEYMDGKYTLPKNLGDTINSEKRDEDPYISPEGDYLIFLSDRLGGYGDRDLYISYRQDNDKWRKAINMGERVNSDSVDKWPIVSSGGKILMFVSGRDSGKKNQFYWIDAKIIEELKPKELNK